VLYIESMRRLSSGYASSLLLQELTEPALLVLSTPPHIKRKPILRHSFSG
jgi:hypothetical protein